MSSGRHSGTRDGRMSANLSVLVQANRFFKHRQLLKFVREGGTVLFFLDGERFWVCPVRKKVFCAICRRSLVTVLVHLESGNSEYTFAIRPWEVERAKAWATELFRHLHNPESILSVNA